MGNKIARTTQSSASEYYLHDLPSSYNLVLSEVLGRGRFFKSIKCKHDEGLVLVKVYFKRGDSIDLTEYERRLNHIRQIFRALDHPHVWPFQFWLETDKAAYLLRQHFFHNLHDRLSTPPFLSLIEKKWLTFQLLFAVKQSHDNGVCHGDIKCENVLITSWNWLYLADFASFKPTYIPDDDPSDFSFFFDTGGRRRCYLAPERFYDHGGELQASQDAPLKPSMDIFSAGCVVAELFLEGQPLFELSQLLAYRRGQYDPSQVLDKILDSGVRQMILHMIQLDPELRLSADSYLQSYVSVVFPSYFSPFLHNFYSWLNPLDTDTRVDVCQRAFHEILKQMMNDKTSTGDCTVVGTNTNPGSLKALKTINERQILTLDKDSFSKKYENGILHYQFQLLGDINGLLKDVKQDNSYGSNQSLQEAPKFSSIQDDKYDGVKSSGKPPPTSVKTTSEHPLLKKVSLKRLDSLMSEYDKMSDSFGMPLKPLPQNGIRCEGMVLIASLLCSCIRNVKLSHLRRGGVLLLKTSSMYIDDEDRLQHVLPYIIASLSDQAAIVRCAALETLCDILALVRDFPPSDAKIFPEYILPMLSMLPDDSEESVRICYASNISKLALTAYGFLVRSVNSSKVGVIEELGSAQKLPVRSVAEKPGQTQRMSGDAQLAQLRKSIADVVHELVMGPKQTPNIRRALLQDIGNLCCFFGQRQSNEILLPILPAFLNDHDDTLRAVFYEQIVYVCFFVGQRSVEEYLLPYIEQALSDATESVIVNALDCLSILCKSSFLRKRILLDLIDRAFPLLCYPSHYVRRSAVTFIAAISESLGPVDSYVYLSPVVSPLLRRQPTSLKSEKDIVSCLKPPMSRQVFYQLLENALSSDMLKRQRKIWYNPSNQFENLDMPNGTGDKTSMKKWTEKTHKTLDNGVVDCTQLVSLIEHNNYAIDDDKCISAKNNRQKTKDMVDVHEPSEKLQISGFMSPQTGGMNSLIYDKPSEGIPLYSFSMDRRAVGAPPAASDTASQANPFGIGSSYSPWMGSLHKSVNLAHSVPAPKLVSGSFSISNGAKQFHRVVHESDGKESEQLSISGQFQDMENSSSLKGSGTSREDVSPAGDLTGLIARTSSVTDSGWKPRGLLVAHLQEHSSAVNDIAISADQNFFVSASDDSTVKLWDARKLEKDISFRSRLTYPLEGSRALCTTLLRGSAEVIVGAANGVMHMFSVDYISRGLGNVVEKYSGVADVKQKNVGEGAILSLLNHSMDSGVSPMIMYSTQNCGIHLWDTRAEHDTWTLKATPEEGYVSSLVLSPCGNWFVSGSSRGVLTLWDLRFLIPVNSWQYANMCVIEKMCLFVPPSSASLSNIARPLVYVAAGSNEASLWNAENGSCYQVFRMANNDSEAEAPELPWALAKPSSKPSLKPDLRRNVNLKYRVDELNEPPPMLPGVRSMLPLPGGDLITGGTDLKIRRWDHSRPEKSYCICGPNLKGATNDDIIYETKSNFGVQVVKETTKRPVTTKYNAKAVLAAAAVDSGGCHRDSVTSLASVKLNQRLLISSARDGAIKVWK
uniref:non-specific serine/threonine protein kinase n=1 Tax=Kalanchoe fedtschenkoi TaxID=63787 RepID=A0A7N1A303_KALFE